MEVDVGTREELAREGIVEVLVPRLGARELLVEQGDLRIRMSGSHESQPLAAARLDDRGDQEAVEKVLGASAAPPAPQRPHVRIAAVGSEHESAPEEKSDDPLEVLKLFHRERRARGDEGRPVRVVGDEPHRGAGGLALACRVVREKRVEIAEDGGEPVG